MRFLTQLAPASGTQVRDAPHEYWWVAKGENHETLCHSEMLGSKQQCIDTIRVIKRGAATGGV